MTRYYIEWQASNYTILEADSLDEAIEAIRQDPKHPEGLIECGPVDLVIDMDESGEYIE